ncbi:alpha/beta hydrolase [Shimia sediminis]|uniref:alpha/beta hydrolase n=1 Tax=Shimia sediminis TaxID=2497945 RepID=UPI000F8CBF1A|nr:alpha/beta fold hydrolase [Shimia sediminis]
MRVLVRLFVVLLVLVLGTVVLGSMAERWVIYPFDPREVSPENVGLPEVAVQRLDINGASLVVWVADPKRGKPVILYFHGNAGNLANRKGRFQHFLNQGYGLIAPAYRGSSGSSGSPSEEVLIADAAALYVELDLSKRPVVVYGESLGTAVSIALVETLAAPPSAVILEAPFTSIPGLAGLHYPGTGSLAENLDNTWRSIDRASALTMPLLILHGTQDDLIPNEMGRQIFTAAPSREKDFHAVQGAGHTDLWRASTQARLWRFIDAYALDLR